MIAKKSKLITDDIKKLVQSACNTQNITKYELDHFNSFRLGRVNVTCIKGQKPVMHIDENYDGTYQNIWMHDVGRVLLRELRKENPDLYEVKTSTFKALLKLVTENDIDWIKEDGLIHISIGDNQYVIIKAVSRKKSYSDSTDDYEFVYDEEDENAEVVEEVDDYDDEEDDSYALF